MKGGGALTRREALTTVAKVAVGAGVVAAASILGGYYATRPSAPPASSVVVEPGFTSLFDGATLDGWQQAGPGGFNVVGGALQSFGGMGLLWYTKKAFADFVLKVDWKVVHSADNSGVFVRFPDPKGDPWNAVNQGYEVQIDDFGAPDGNPLFKTGGIYSFAGPREVASNAPGEWNYYEIHAVGQQYTVILNGVDVTDFAGSRSTEGYVGLQNHSGTVTFRNIRIKEL